MLSICYTLISTHIALTHALPQPFENTPSAKATLPLNLPRADEHVECIENRPLQPSHRGEIQQCARAALGLPQAGAPGTFHANGPGDAYHLPVESINGDCRVTVGFVPGATQERTSWAQIYATINSLIIACESLALGTTELVTGGYTTTGDRHQLTIGVENTRVEPHVQDVATA